MFRGREMTHPERGRTLLLRLAEDVKDIAVIESSPLQDGRNMVMLLGPSKAVLAAAADGEEAAAADQHRVRGGDVTIHEVDEATAAEPSTDSDAATDTEQAADPPASEEVVPDYRSTIRGEQDAEGQNIIGGKKATARNRHRKGDAAACIQVAPARTQEPQAAS